MSTGDSQRLQRCGSELYRPPSHTVLPWIRRSCILPWCHCHSKRMVCAQRTWRADRFVLQRFHALRRFPRASRCRCHGWHGRSSRVAGLAVGVHHPRVPCTCCSLSSPLLNTGNTCKCRNNLRCFCKIMLWVACHITDEPSRTLDCLPTSPTC